jgi:hypothetical protein
LGLRSVPATDDVSKALREVNDAQVEFGLFRGCLSYNKINHLLRTCPPDLLEDALGKFDDHFQSMVADILRVGCLAEDQWEQASLPVRLSGLGVSQTRVTAGSAFVGSCALTKDLVAQLLGKDGATYEPDGVSELFAAHEAVTGNLHDFASLCTEKSVQKLLSTERHENTLARLKSRSSIRSQNLMMAVRCRMRGIGCLRHQLQVLVLASSQMSFAQHSNFDWVFLFSTCRLRVQL